MFQKSVHENWNNHVPEVFHPHTTPLCHLAIWLVQSSEDMISMDYCPVQDETVDPGMLFEEGYYLVHQMHNHTKVDSMKDIRYNNSHWEMHFILQQIPCVVPTPLSSRCCLASQLCISPLWVVCIIIWKYSGRSLTCRNDEFPSPNDHSGCNGIVKYAWLGLPDGHARYPALGNH